MKLPLLFARRYIFSKKSTNAIHIISGVSVLGITLGGAALLIILSVFNGFEDLLRKMISSFKPDVQVSIKEGKVFALDSVQWIKIQDIEGIAAVSQTLEELALFGYDDVQQLGMMKGVDSAFTNVIYLDTAITAGSFSTYDHDKQIYYGVVGAALEYALGVVVESAYQEPIKVYMPRRDKKNLSGTQAFKQRDLYPSATYSVQQPDFDKYLIARLDFAQEILSYKQNEISALEIRLASPQDEKKVVEQLQNILGDGFSIRNRYQQDEAFFKITNTEKWVGFLIFAFTLGLVAFNMVGALWMLVLEKKTDIATLKAMGATNALIRNIFLMEGALLSLIGGVVGCIIAAVLCWLQQQFGFVQLQGSGGFVIDSYPVSMRVSDFVLVLGTVLLIGTLAAWLPAWRASRISSIVNEG